MTLDQQIDFIDIHIKTYEHIIKMGVGKDFERNEKECFCEILESLEMLKILKDNLYLYVDREGQENVRAILKLTEPVDVQKYKIIKEWYYNE